MAQKPTDEHPTATALPPNVRADLRSQALRRVFINGAIAVVGMVASYVSYNSATHAGGTYFLWWGAILFGGYRAIEALSRYRDFK